MFSPARGKLVVRRDIKREETAGGIVVPGTSDEGRKPSCTGTVVAVGAPRIKGKKRRVIPVPCEVGDRVSFSQWVAEGLCGQLDSALVGQRDCYLYEDFQIDCVIPKEADVDDVDWPRDYTECSPDDEWEKDYTV